MATSSKSLLALTAQDVMSRDVVAVSQNMSLCEAAHLFRQGHVSGAPVVDDDGRCVGVLSAVDFVRWAEERCCPSAPGVVATCPFQVKGRLLTGDEAVICTLAWGACPLQVLQPTTDGRHTALCAKTASAPRPAEATQELLSQSVRRFMTTDIVTARPATPLTSIARMMLDAHIHRVLVLDEQDRPLGIVTSTDLVAVLAAQAPDGRG